MAFLGMENSTSPKGWWNALEQKWFILNNTALPWFWLATITATIQIKVQVLPKHIGSAWKYRSATELCIYLMQ
jgi:hypothetical protein